MPTRKTYWVQYLDNRWKVRHEGRTLSVHVVKSDAVDAGIKIAKANAPSELIICRQDGTIEDKPPWVVSRQFVDRMSYLRALAV